MHPTTSCSAPGSVRQRSARWLAFVAAVAAVAVGATCAYHGLVPSLVGREHVDKVLHFAMGATLAGLLDRALDRRARRTPAGAVPLAAVLVLVTLGAEEYLQRFSASRTSSVGDFTADALGVLAGIWACRRASRSRP